MKNKPAIADAIQTFLNTLTPTAQIYIAYSGGVDSHVLLEAFSTSNCIVKAIHVNHHLQNNSNAWQAHCQDVCNTLHVELIHVELNINLQPGDSLEAKARDARYNAFKSLLRKNDYLLTAHHQDDQAETLLLQLCRGAGIKGLSAMPSSKPLGKGFHARPLLDISRDDILEYAASHRLQWIEDGSNQDTQYSRNFLRHKILPTLQQHWPQATKTMARSARLIAASHELIDELGALDLTTMLNQDQNTLHIDRLLALSTPRQHNVLRYWLHQQHITLPSEKILLQIDRLLHAKPDANPMVCWNQIALRRYQNNLYLLPQTITERPKAITWNLTQALELPDGLGTLTAHQTQGKGVHCPQSVVTIDFRKTGETIALARRGGHHALKKLFQEWHIPPWQRARIPLIYIDDQLAAIAGYAIDKSHEVHDKDKWGWIIEHKKTA